MSRFDHQKKEKILPCFFFFFVCSLKLWNVHETSHFLFSIYSLRLRTQEDEKIPRRVTEETSEDFPLFAELLQDTDTGDSFQKRASESVFVWRSSKIRNGKNSQAINEFAIVLFFS